MKPPVTPADRVKTATLPTPPTGDPAAATVRRILLVDDDDSVRTSIGNVLEMEGYAVVAAHDGHHAVELAAQEEFDLVLLDLNMPRKNGWDTFEELTREHPLLPVVVITARPNQLFTAVGAGAGALVEKPMDIPTLLQTIRTLLAESVTHHLARLAGKAAQFHYKRAVGKR
jgi:DNA-binding response OmpR family regulator